MYMKKDGFIHYDEVRQGNQHQRIFQKDVVDPVRDYISFFPIHHIVVVVEYERQILLEA